jgi:sugar lactone lactonase YvrE
MRTSLRSILAILGAALLLGALAVPIRADILYASDIGFGAIQRITGDGAITFSPPHYPWWIGGLTNPGGLAFDQSGILYVGLDGKIEKFSQTGTDLGLFANIGAGALAFDRAGDLYAVTGSTTIMKFTPDGVGSVFADANDGLTGATALAFDSAENLYVSNYGSSLAERRVIKLSPDGIGSVFASGGLGAPHGIAVDRADNVYLLDSPASTPSIWKFTLGGVRTLFADVNGEGDAGLAFDGAGNLYYGGGHLTGFIGKLSPDGVPLNFNPQPVSQPTFFAFTDDNGVPVPFANQRPAPEPGTWALLAVGLPALLGLSRSRRPAGRACR